MFTDIVFNLARVSTYYTIKINGARSNYFFSVKNIFTCILFILARNSTYYAIKINNSQFKFCFLRGERPRRRKRWRTRPTSNPGPPRWRKRWPTTPTNNVGWPRRRKRWWLRPTSDSGPPRGTKRWPTRLTSDVATSRPNALRLRRQKRLLRMSTTRMTTMFAAI